MLELEANATPLEGARPPGFGPSVPIAGDFDGDGVSDVLLRDADEHVSLFYGRPGLFDAGIDFARPDAALTGDQSGRLFYAVGDRDADGDDEMLERFPDDREQQIAGATNLALSSGSRERLSQAFAFAESEVVAATPKGRFPNDPYRQLDVVVPAGDLDGDGAADVITLSNALYEQLDGGFAVEAPQVHIHYGSPTAPLAAQPR